MTSTIGIMCRCGQVIQIILPDGHRWKRVIVECTKCNLELSWKVQPMKKGRRTTGEVCPDEIYDGD